MIFQFVFIGTLVINAIVATVFVVDDLRYFHARIDRSPVRVIQIFTWCLYSLGILIMACCILTQVIKEQ